MRLHRDTIVFLLAVGAVLALFFGGMIHVHYENFAATEGNPVAGVVHSKMYIPKQRHDMVATTVSTDGYPGVAVGVSETSEQWIVLVKLMGSIESIRAEKHEWVRMTNDQPVHVYPVFGGMSGDLIAWRVRTKQNPRQSPGGGSP